MRLIGGHDYYDGAGMGVDTSVVFVRDPARHLFQLETRRNHPFRVPKTLGYGGGAERTDLLPTLILIGGERVPALEERVTRAWKTASEFHFVFPDALRAVEQARERHPSRVSPWGWRGFPDDLRNFFETGIRPEETGWLIDNHVTVLTTWWPPFWKEKTVPAQINHACLKELELYKRLDPTTAHMRIAAFISGVLPFQRETVELSDKDRIRKAGFDLKASFRRAPEQKKRVRQG